MKASRSLITFAFVKEEFDKTGDIIRGLMPLFGPVFDKLAGRVFSPSEFTKEVELFYGIKMHPWAAEDWAPRFEVAGFLSGSGDSYQRSYTCLPQPESVDGAVYNEIAAILDDLISHVSERLSLHQISIEKNQLESGIIDRLHKFEFLNLLLKPNNVKFGNTLTLPAEGLVKGIDKEAIIDFALASRILYMHDVEPFKFQRVSEIASGALVSEIVLALRNPPALGQKAKGSIVYFDSPFIIDLLDFADKEQNKYAIELLDDLKQLGVHLRTYAHNVEEIRAILVAALDGYGSIVSSSGTVAYRIRTDGTARSRAQLARANLSKKISELGIQTIDMKKPLLLQKCILAKNG